MSGRQTLVPGNAVENLRASIPTMLTVLCAVGAAAWFIANELGAIRSDVGQVRQTQAYLAEGVREARNGQAKVLTELGAINVKIGKMEQRVEDLNEEVDERITRRRR